MPATLKTLLATAFIAAASLSVAATGFEGDPVKGENLFKRCKACHNLTAAERPRLGPNLDNLFGRRAGSTEGFKYSKALTEADFIWDEAHMDEWLKNPRAFLPGNRMAFPGLKKDEDRADLIAYLKEATKAE